MTQGQGELPSTHRLGLAEQESGSVDPSFSFVQPGYDHRGRSRRGGALLHLAGSTFLLPEEAEEAEEEGDNEKDPARTRGGCWPSFAAS